MKTSMEDESHLKDTAFETIKFALVGISGIGVNFLMIALCLNIFETSDELALALGIFVSMTSNYLLNRVWTFQSDKAKLNEYPKYILSNLIGVGLQYVIALSLENYFERMGRLSIDLLIIELPTIYAASFIGILVGFVTNFSLSKYFVFTAQ